jgi:bifunctional non-homologous end joining protein LigD
VTWEEVERTLKKKDANLLVFEAPQTVSRVEKMGDLFAPVLELKQRLPDLKAVAVAAAETETPISIAAQAEAEEEPKKTHHRAARKTTKPRPRKAAGKV